MNFPSGRKPANTGRHALQGSNFLIPHPSPIDVTMVTVMLLTAGSARTGS